jgi:predicted HicB family RNase H-like nuclease
MKRQTGFRLTEKAHEWLRAQAQERGISRNDVIQELINEEMGKGLKADKGEAA